MKETDPLLEEAATRVEAAYEALAKATFLLNYREGTRPLQEVAMYLRKVAECFKEGNRDAGLAVELVDRKWAARVLGKHSTTKKRRTLEKARAVLAEKRAFLKAGQRQVVMITSSPSGPHTDIPEPTEVGSASL